MKFNYINKFLYSILFSSASAYELLKEYAGDLKIGVAGNTNKFSDSNYNEALKAFNMMVAENGCKLSGIQQQKGVYNYDDCDAHYNKAKELGMEFRGHCLIWHSYQPSWFENADASTLKTAIVDHITNVLKHYEGKIKVWDVVNEAIDDGSSSDGFKMRNSFLYQKVPDFVDLAFQTARKVSPNTKLFYNDYNAEGQFPKSEAIYNFVSDLKKRDIPIDGVGLQYHVSSQSQPTYDQINSLIGRYCKLGLEVHITELDVKLQNDEKGQTQAYTNALKACLANSCCKAYLVWGVGDNDSWLGANEKALLFDGSYQPKAIYTSILNVLKENGGNKASSSKDSPAKTTKTIPAAAAVSTKNTPTKNSGTKIISGSTSFRITFINNTNTKTLPNASVSKTKTIPNVTKTLPDISKTKTLPNGTKTLPSGTKTLPNVSESSTKALPNGTKTLPNGTKTLPNGTKTLPSGTKTLPNVSESSTKALPNGTKTLPKTLTTKAVPDINTTKTIPSASNNSEKCTPATVTVTVTVYNTENGDDSNCVAKWGQCGGNMYSGPKCCKSGSTCKEFNEWYSQCI